jgi:hypothetical protein
LPLFSGQFLDAFFTDNPVFVVLHVIGVTAKKAGRLVLLQDDLFTVYVNLQGIFNIDSQSSAQLNRDYHPAEFIYFAYDTCGLQQLFLLSSTRFDSFIITGY